MTRPLPVVNTLQQAVIAVIDSNKKDGYPPTRFIQITQDGNAPGLQQICERLILKGEVLQSLEAGLRHCKLLLSLEDLVLEYGQAWGFSSEIIENAKARVIYFDKFVGIQRYNHSPIL